MKSKLLFSITAVVLFTTPSLRGQNTLPYHNMCDDIATVTVLNENNSSTGKWHAYSFSGNSVFRCKQSSSNAVRDVHATLWTPALDIQTGKLYRASVVVGTQNTRNLSNAELAMYTFPDASAAKTTLLETGQLPTFSSTFRPQAIAQIFLGDATKPYLGIKNSGGGAISYFILDDIVVEEYTGNIPPKAAESLTASSTGKNITIDFTLPTQDVANNDISVIPMTYILRDNKVIKEYADQQAGASITFSDAVSTAGQYVYSIVCVVNDMQSRKDITVAIEGNKTPSQCTSYERDEDGNLYGRNYYAPAVFIPGQGIKITWKPSSDASATYTVIRINDNKEIANNTTSTSALDSDFRQDTPTTYQYLIKQNIDSNTEDLYTSSVVSLNNTIPFSPAINDEAINEFTIIDSNPDNTAWDVTTSGAVEKHGVSKFFTISRRGDDWLITPGVTVEAGKTYRIDVDAFCADLIESNVKLQIMAGKSNSIEEMTEEIMPAVTFNHLFPETYTAFYTPSAGGNAFIGIRSLDPTGQNSFDDMGISNISITEVPGNAPEAIKDLHIIYGSTPGTASLMFTAPSKNLVGSPITSLDKIEVLQDNVEINTIDNPVPGQKYNIDVTLNPSKQANFKVIPYTSAGDGLPANISAMLHEAPYTTSFETADELLGYTIINPDLSGDTWGYMPTRQAVRSFAFSNDTHNEYLITPAIHLEKGHFYKLDFITWLEGADNSDYMENNAVEVLLGTSPAIDALTTTIVQPYVIQGTLGNEVLLKEWFSVPETGVYYIAWHAMSKPLLAEELFIDNVNISAKIPDTYPAAVDNFAIVPAPDGALKATISFDLPTKDMAGNALTTDFHGYKIYCDGIEISNGPGTPGQHIAFDHNTSQGVHLYTVRCFGADNEPTRDVENVAFVGINRPGAVEFVEVDENPDKYGEVTITWGLPSNDIDGFALNTSDISYTVGEYYTDPNDGTKQEIIYDTNVKELSYTKVVKTNVDQEFMRFFVRAKTSAGEGNPTVITKFTAIGKPFDLPFTESFSNGNAQHSMMQERPFEGKMAQWGYNTTNPVTGVTPVDGDKGLALMEVLEADNGARLYTLRINLNTEKPTMTFYVYNQSNAQRTDNNLLGISIREGNGDFEVVANKSIDEWAEGNPGWHKVSLDLSAYAGKVVYIGLDGMAKNFTFIHVDNIMIAAPADIDVAVSSINHPSIYVGLQHDIEVNLLNTGGEDVNNAIVNLYLDETLIDTRDIEQLSSGEEMTLTFTNTLTREHIGKHMYRAEILVDNDADWVNNTHSAPSFYLSDNNFPTVENLQATQTNNEIQLSWESPIIPDAPQVVTDDFENYPSWSTMETGGLGDYILVDVDGCGVGGFQNFEIPNIPYGSKQSFTLWDFSNEHFAYDQTISDRYKAHSGDKCLVSIFAPGEDTWTEDRLISPRLTGEAQTISFYAKSLDDAYPEIFQVYYSFDGTLASDYIDNRFPRQSVGGSWTKFSYDLPEGTQYFVIEHYSNAFFLFLDDLTYTPIGNETLVGNGYNIYRENIKLNDAPIHDFYYNDNNALDSNIKYGVSAVYDRGESPVKEVTVSNSGIDDILASVNVFADNGEIVITGAQDLDLTIVTSSGVIMTSRKASALERIPVQPGIYLVNIAGKGYKIAIK